jgi:hypothetical protein
VNALTLLPAGVGLVLLAGIASLHLANRPLQQGPITRYRQYIVLTVLVLLGSLFVSLATHR